MNGWLALSPLIVFILIYLISSIIAKDFYKVPIASAFVLASIYAIIITPGSISERIGIFSKGAGDLNVLLMIWIFVMAGAFASVAKSIGTVEATVNLTLTLLPQKFLLAGLFIAACFISFSIGTSVGTIVALVPIAAGISGETAISMPLITAVIVGGAFFGDNLSFISDTTIASTTTQGCSMSDKFKANIWIAGPAAIVVTAVYIFIGLNLNASPEIGDIDMMKLIPYLAVILLSLCGMNVLLVLTIGLVLCAAIGFLDGLTWVSFLESAGSGISGMGDLIIVTMLAGGMLEVIRHNGGIDFIIKGLTKKIKGKRGAEFSIAALVGISNICTANNTIAILTTGNIAKNITKEYNLDPRKSASLLDTFSCIVQGMLPYGAQLLMASSFAGISATSIISHLYYPFTLFFFAFLSIIIRFPRRYS
ncbi:MAG: Na+/H+ antiporter NhaC family protein [Bacteroidales bacterium]|nr:Na+/H+ antiporter NhaC family protein [Bacteroidales bacterium]MDY2936420.1 Na+/H+ antiporter NhaC family protein [Candidatus Cryptobacteroides sp.]